MRGHATESWGAGNISIAPRLLFKAMQHLRSIALYLALGIASFCGGQTYFSMGNAVGGGGLYRAIDLCEPQLLTLTPGFGYLDLTVLADRRLLGCRFANPAGFYLIDTITGAASFIGEPDPYMTPTAMETDSDSTILIAEGGQSHLYRLHLPQLSASVVGNMGYEADGDFLLLGDTLFVATANPNALVRIRLSTDHQAIIQVVNVGELTVPNVWGLALPPGFRVEYPDCILAAAGQQLYAVNTNTAEMTAICNALTSGSFFGAAAVKGDPQDPSLDVSESTPCNWSPQLGTVVVGEAGMDAALKAWLPSTHALIQWSLFDAVGRYVAGEQGPTIDGLGNLTQGLYILGVVVQDPCGLKIFVPGIRLRV